MFHSDPIMKALKDIFYYYGFGSLEFRVWGLGEGLHE